jgi:hypothetical protein
VLWIQNGCESEYMLALTPILYPEHLILPRSK